jgi:hypothetical protein
VVSVYYCIPYNSDHCYADERERGIDAVGEVSDNRTIKTKKVKSERFNPRERKWLSILLCIKILIIDV